jgi:glycosyltransferase involved in cell wall biosynthesis
VTSPAPELRSDPRDRSGAPAAATGVDVCLCTHDPRPGTLERALGSLARQRAPAGTFRVLLVDNASSPPVDDAVLAPVRAAGIAARLVREPVAGLTRARLRAVAETGGRWILLLDDDNELREDYVEEGLRFAAERTDVGCFGGKLLLPDGHPAPRWARPFHSWMAIREDAGDEVITGSSDEWGVWEPPGAGAFVRRDVAEEWRRRFGDDARLLALGRTGKRNLASCEDSLMMRQARRLGLLNAYVPRLVLRHHVDPSRFRFGYLLRLMHAYGTSLVELDALVKGRVDVPAYYRGGLYRFLKVAWAELRVRRRGTTLPFAVAKIVFHWRARASYRRLERTAP